MNSTLVVGTIALAVTIASASIGAAEAAPTRALNCGELRSPDGKFPSRGIENLPPQMSLGSPARQACWPRDERGLGAWPVEIRRSHGDALARQAVQDVH